MHAPEFHFKRRFYVGAALALAAIAAWWVWSERLSRDAGGAAKAPEPFVRVGGADALSADRVLRERADFFDPAPLFVPTARNYGRGQLPPRLIKQPGQVFGDFGAKLNFAEGGLAAYGAENPAAGEGLADVLSRSNEVPFAGLGENGAGRPRLPARSAVVQIKKMGGSELHETSFADLVVPRTDFAPLEFVVAVGPAGLIGDPLLSVGSGHDEVDVFFQTFLAKTYRLGTLLPPGRYRVMIGP
ncbi:MAG: hypothetical protein C0502_09240 [Opitutus sp.]|nr:hypothetical protein [Opitutus sp.]